MHDIFSLVSILGPKVTIGSLSLWFGKLKISKCLVLDQIPDECLVLDQIPDECYLCLLLKLCGIILFIIFPQTNLFMF
jgi:hypothetical protein